MSEEVERELHGLQIMRIVGMLVKAGSKPSFRQTDAREEDQ